MRHMLNHIGLPPIKTWMEKFLPSRVSRRGRHQLRPEFHADVEFWRVLLEGALGSPVVI